MVTIKKSILYFIEGSSPTEKDMEAAAKIGTSKFRNASAFFENDTLELCDGVAGFAPDQYKAKFPYIVPEETVPVAPVDTTTPLAPPAPWQK